MLIHRSVLIFEAPILEFETDSVFIPIIGMVDWMTGGFRTANHRKIGAWWAYFPMVGISIHIWSDCLISALLSGGGNALQSTPGSEYNWFNNTAVNHCYSFWKSAAVSAVESVCVRFVVRLPTALPWEVIIASIRLSIHLFPFYLRNWLTVEWPWTFAR